jgi:tetratricopeptide (TPR) repeat protein
MNLDVRNSWVQLRYSELLAGMGQLPEAMAAAKMSLNADPLSTAAWKDLGKGLMHARQFAAALEAFRRAEQISSEARYRYYVAQAELLNGHVEEALALRPSLTPPSARFITALAAHDLGRSADSEIALRDLTSRYAQTWAYQIAQIYAWRGDINQAFEWLDRSFVQHDAGLQWIKTDPFLDSVRADARYKALLRKMNLPQ